MFLPIFLSFYIKCRPHSPLSFDNGWMDGNPDCCVNTVNENITAATNLVL